MSTHLVLFGYVAVLLGALVVLAIYYDRRQRRFGPARSRDSVFRCVNCGLVYTDDADVDRSRCPQCGETNDPYSF